MNALHALPEMPGVLKAKYAKSIMKQELVVVAW
jgi:hypothetical protein